MPDGVDTTVDAVKLSCFNAFRCERFGYSLSSQLIKGDNAALGRGQIRDLASLLYPLVSAVPQT